jgi:hypothetical protein
LIHKKHEVKSLTPDSYFLIPNLPSSCATSGITYLYRADFWYN